MVPSAPLSYRSAAAAASSAEIGCPPTLAVKPVASITLPHTRSTVTEVGYCSAVGRGLQFSWLWDRVSLALGLGAGHRPPVMKLAISRK